MSEPAGTPPPDDVATETATETEAAGDQTRYARGLRVRREVLGEEHVERTLERMTDFDAEFQRFLTEVAWGDVWARPGLDRRTRSLITIAILAALGRLGELALHLRATQNTGAQPDEIAEALLHVAVYAGVPAANSAFALAKTELAQQAGAAESATASAAAARRSGAGLAGGSTDSGADEGAGEHTEGQAQ